METKGQIFNIQRFSVNDGPGIRTTIFFKGCPLNCIWCHNPECLLPNFNTQTIKFYKPGEILSILKKDILFFEESGGGVSFSGGEPTMQKEFLIHLLTLCKNENMSTALDTCGYVSFKDLEDIADIVDIFLYDLKIMDELEHIKYTGVSNKLIHDNLKQLSNIHKNIFIRIPLIPGITDTEKNLNAILEFISTLNNIREITLLPYNELCRNKYIKVGKQFELGNMKTQSDETLTNFTSKFTSRGFDVKIRG